MVQTIINLNESEDRFLNIFKAKRGIKSKNEAVKTILKEYECSLKCDKEEKFNNSVREAIEEYERNPNKRKLTKKQFLDEINQW